MTRESSIWLILTLLGTAAFAGAIIVPLFGINIGPFGFIVCAVAWMLILGYRDSREVFHSVDSRSKEMQQAADQLQFSFRDRSPCNVLGWSQSFLLTRDEFRKVDGLKTAQSEGNISGRLCAWVMPESRNAIEGTVADAQVAIFDFQRDAPGGLEDEKWTQTVMAVQSPRLDFPHFALLPATFWSKVSNCFLATAVSRLPLPDGYRMITEDTAAANALIPRLTDWLDGETSIEAGEEFLLVYRRDKLVEPAKVENFVELGLHLCGFVYFEKHVMGESTKVICLLVLIVSSLAGAIAWFLDRPDAMMWGLRIGGPSMAFLALGLLLRLHFRTDIAHDYLRELAGGHDYYDCDGLSFIPFKTTVEGIAHCGIYFQNQRDHECLGRIAFRPTGGYFMGRAAMETISYEIDCAPAAFGVARIAVPVPEEQQATCLSSEVSVAVDYPRGKGRRLRFRDGVSPVGMTFDLPVGAIDTVLDREIKTYWKLGDPPLTFPLREVFDGAGAQFEH